MSYRNANYTAFYVADPKVTSNLGPHAARDFACYRLLCAWKTTDPTFPFIDAHAKTAQVRDTSQWGTLQQRLHARLSTSKNMLLFLSDETKNSQALREEIEYGINYLKLPIIIIYPDCKNLLDIAIGYTIKYEWQLLWDKIPALRNNMYKVPTLHIPFTKDIVAKALRDQDFMVQTATTPNQYFYPWNTNPWI